jgi:hypothetical protein
MTPNNTHQVTPAGGCASWLWSFFICSCKVCSLSKTKPHMLQVKFFSLGLFASAVDICYIRTTNNYKFWFKFGSYQCFISPSRQKEYKFVQSKSRIVQKYIIPTCWTIDTLLKYCPDYEIYLNGNSLVQVIRIEMRP